MISKIQKLGYKVEASAPCDSSSLLSYKQYWCNEQAKSFVLHFPQTPVNVKKIKVNLSTDVFPVSWEIQISKNGQNYETLKSSTEAFCESKCQVNHNTKNIYCSKSYQRIFDISTRSDQQASYVKFLLIKNTWYENTYYDKVINFYGFELLGDFYVKYKRCTLSKQSRLNTNIILYLIINRK